SLCAGDAHARDRKTKHQRGQSVAHTHHSSPKPAIFGRTITRRRDIGQQTGLAMGRPLSSPGAISTRDICRMRDQRPILVTGAAGLIGRRVVEMLAADGRATRATDRARAVDETIALEPADLTDVAAVDRLVTPHLAGIIHCGAVSGPMLGR